MNAIVDAHERRLAIDPTSSYLVQAPAGSGKTELLVQRILALLAHVEQPEEILALTFTRKAAAEMRERVLSALHRAQQPEPESAHARTTWQLAHHALRRSQEKGWQLTEYPAQLRIMTLDSFASGLARQLPILSGFGQSPTTSDFTDPLYLSAVHDLIGYAHQKNAPAQLKQAVNSLVLHFDCNFNKVSDLLCMMLSRREQWLPDVLEHTNNMASFKIHLEESLEAVIEHTLLEAYDAIPANIKGGLPALVCFAEQQLSLVSNHEPHLLSSLKGFTAFPKPELSNVEQWQAIVDLLLTSGGKANFRKQVNKNQGFPTGASYKDQKDTMKSYLDALQGHEHLLSLLLQVRLLPRSSTFNEDDWQVLEALFTTLKMLAGQLWQTFEKHKKVDFIEVMLRAKQALGQYDERGNILPSEALLRLDYQIKHILVDEFQDTSTPQVDLLSRLTAGWEEDGRTLFMVGDPMQSIYRFRKAEVSLFLKAGQNKLPLPKVTPLTLSQNFRSSPHIVNWINKAFERILPAKNDILAGAITYSPSQAFKDDKGQVTLHIFEPRNDQQEAEVMIDIIRKAKTKGKSIGILARSRPHLHTLMHLLQKQDIAFRALEMLPLNSVSEIIDLRSLTCALTHPCDFVAWAALLRSPAVGVSLTTLLAIFSAKPEAPWPAIQSYSKDNPNAEDIERLQHFITAISPAILKRGRVSLRKLVESTWLNLKVPCLLNTTQLSNAELFLELLEHIEDEEAFEVALLDKRLEKLYAKPESSPSSGQVELMTMHGAKGLQWDTVILPSLGKAPSAKDKDILVKTEINTLYGQQFLLAPLSKPSATGNESASIYQLIRAFEKQRDQLEVARLLYVACTRAESELHLLGDVSESTEEPKASSLMALLWQSQEECYGASINKYEQQSQDKTTLEQPIYSNFTLPPHQRVQDININVTPEPDIPVTTHFQPIAAQHQPEFSWAGASAKAVGIALHAALQQLGETGIESWSKQDSQQAIQTMQNILQRDGISKAHIDKALQRCITGLNRCLKPTSKTHWICSLQHQEQHNEWPLTYVEGGVCKHIVIDRSFVDDEGVRWIIDYKTGDHQGTDLDAFLDQELIRYTQDTPQLPNYVKALQALEPERTIKAALYFPMMDGWRVWQS